MTYTRLPALAQEVLVVTVVRTQIGAHSARTSPEELRRSSGVCYTMSHLASLGEYHGGVSAEGAWLSKR